MKLHEVSEKAVARTELLRLQAALIDAGYHVKTKRTSQELPALIATNSLDEDPFEIQIFKDFEFIGDVFYIDHDYSGAVTTVALKGNNVDRVIAILKKHWGNN